MKTITLSEYAKLIGYNKKPKTLQEIQDFAETELDWTIWDYPIEEIDYVLNNVTDNIVYVETEFGIRICEY